MVQLVSITDCGKEIFVEYFHVCLSRVTFGRLSSLNVIWEWAFHGSGVIEIHIRDGVKEFPRNSIPSSVQIMGLQSCRELNSVNNFFRKTISDYIYNGVRNTFQDCLNILVKISKRS